MNDIIAELDETGSRIVLHETLWADKPLVAQIPGKAWDTTAKRWTLPKSWAACVQARAIFGDRLKVGQLLGGWARLEKTRRDTALRYRDARTPVDLHAYDRDNDHAEKLYPFQVPGRDFMVAAKFALLGDEMGCIAGDAQIKVHRNGATRTMSMRELHRKFHGGATRGRVWDTTAPTRVKSMFADGTLLLNDVVDVMARGQQRVIRLTMESGRTIRCTPDHRMSTGVGTWAEARSLHVGDALMVNGEAVCTECGGTDRVTTYAYAKFPGLCRPCVYKKRGNRVGPLGPGRYADKNGYVMLTGFPEHPNADANGNVREHVKVMSDVLGRPLRKGELVHHKDENKQNNHPSNLEIKTPAQHAADHGREGGFKHLHNGKAGKGGTVWFRAHTDTIVNIEDAGVVDVYDIEMSAPAHNFVVEGMVVHNSGKTLQALAAMRAVNKQDSRDVWGTGEDAGTGYVEPGAYPALVVCPNSTKRNWAREVRKWLPEATPVVIDGSAAKRRKQLIEAAEVPNAIIIMNIESVRLHSRLAAYGSVRLKSCRECDTVGGDETLTPAKCETHDKELNAIPFKVCVLDEAHRVKDPRALQTRAIWRVFHGPTVEYRWAMTGTPVANHPGDIWSILHTIDPDGFPRKSAFIDRYALVEFNAFGGMSIVGLNPATRDEFLGLLDARFRRMIKTLVLEQLPAKTRVVRHVEMSAKQAKAYKEVAAEYVLTTDSGDKLVMNGNLPAATRLLQLASAMCEVDKGETPNDIGSWKVTLTDPSSKIDELMNIIADNPEKPLAIAAEHKQLIDLAAKRLTAAGIEFGTVTGGVSGAKRDETVEAFQSGKLKYILFTYKAGGVGLNMTAADTLVRLQRSWSLVDNMQGEDRVHRIGSEQHEAITIIDIITADTIEETQVEKLYAKMQRLEEIVRDREQLEASGKSTAHLDAEAARIESLDLLDIDIDKHLTMNEEYMDDMIDGGP